MSNTSKVDFIFRYRPLSDSPDGFLLKYLQTFSPSKRKKLIMNALRSCYLLEAYGSLDTLSPEQLTDLSNSLQENYGSISDSNEILTLDIELAIKKNTYSRIDYISGLDENDDDEDE